MLVSDLFSKLSFGELSNLAMSGNGSGTIVTAQQPKLIGYANDGLLRLHTKFVLKENDLLLQLYEHITFYHLIPRFSIQYTPPVGTVNEPIRYILDLPEEPFNDELLKVTTIYDHLGMEIPLNNEEKHNSCFTPQVKLLQVPNPVDEKFLTVRYQQRHAKLTGDLEQYISLPVSLEEALTSFIAFKVFSHMNTADSNSKAQEFNQTFEQLCGEVTDRDLVSSSISQSNIRFSRGGWV